MVSTVLHLTPGLDRRDIEGRTTLRRSDCRDTEPPRKQPPYLMYHLPRPSELGSPWPG